MAIGPPAGFQSMLERKYDILEKNARADTLRARSGAQAGMIDARSAAGLRGAQAREVTTRTDQQSEDFDLGRLQGMFGAPRNLSPIGAGAPPPARTPSGGAGLPGYETAPSTGVAPSSYDLGGLRPSSTASSRGGLGMSPSPAGRQLAGRFRFGGLFG